MAVTAGMLLVGEFAKMALSAYFESKRLEGVTAEQIQAEFNAEYEKFKASKPEEIPEV